MLYTYLHLLVINFVFLNLLCAIYLRKKLHYGALLALSLNNICQFIAHMVIC